MPTNIVQAEFQLGQIVFLKEQLEKLVTGRIIWRVVDTYKIIECKEGLRKKPLYLLSHCRDESGKLNEKKEVA